MDNSSAIALRDALEKLLINNGNQKFDGNQLYKARMAAHDITQRFEGVNSDLHAGWEDTCNLTNKIESEFDKKLMSLYSYLVKFCDETYYNEAQATAAAEKANTLAEQILTNLNIS